MNDALNDLYALQQVDSALLAANRRFRALDQGLAEKAAAETALELHERLKRTYHETTGDLRDAELEAAAVDKKRKDHETKLYSGQVQNPKELQSMQQEIEALARQKEKLDEKIIILMEQAEARRKEEADSKANRKSAESAYVAKQAAWKAAATTIAREIKGLNARREELVKPVPAPLLKRYDSMRAAKQGVAISKIHGNLCEACHTNLPSNLIRSVKDTDRIELCENCGRMLCID